MLVFNVYSHMLVNFPHCLRTRAVSTLPPPELFSTSAHGGGGDASWKDTATASGSLPVETPRSLRMGGAVKREPKAELSQRTWRQKTAVLPTAHWVRTLGQRG